MAVWGNFGPTIVRLEEPIHPLHVNLRAGTVMSLAYTATGRLFAAFMPPKMVERMIAEDIARQGASPRGVVPSPVPAGEGWSVPREMSVQDIETVIDEFVRAAIRADVAGFDTVELHFGHGYLVTSFLSPISNLRTDEYGGDRSGRMKLAIDIARAVREALPSDKPLWCRLSVVDGAVGGWSEEDTVVLVRELVAASVDVMDCSSGGLTEQTKALPVPRGLGFQVPFARRVKSDTGVVTQAVGMILDPEQAEDVLTSGAADLVAIGREALFDPYWPLHAQWALDRDASFSDWHVRHRVWLQKRQQFLDTVHR